MNKEKTAQEVAQDYLKIWAPHLLDDPLLMEELVEEATATQPLGSSKMHDAVHAYFGAWCAVRASDMLTEQGSGVIRRSRPGEIWVAVVKTDRFADAEFGEFRSANERLAEWFGARVEESMEILKFRLGDEAEEAIDTLDAWLRGQLEASKRRTLVKSVQILREEFGSASGVPEVPEDTKERRPAVLQKMLDDAKKTRTEKRSRAKKALLKFACR